MSPSQVLVITSRPDTHVNSVGRKLHERGIELTRLNTEDLFTNTVIDVIPRDGIGTIEIKDSGRSIQVEQQAAVWYRKPETPSTAHLTIAGDAEQRYFEAESYENLLSIYSVLQDRPWINNPFTTRLAFRRFHQLRVANQIGMRTVDSIFSNSEKAVLRFANDVDGSMALKSLSALSVSNITDGSSMSQFGVLTRTVSKEDMYALRASIGALPTFIQQYIDKRFDLRVICVGDQVFPCRIHSQELDSTQHDFRIGTKGLKHELIELPERLVDQIHSFMGQLQIDFGCFDFVEVEDGDPYFLECNPNGQWLWVEEQTGAPISSAIADRLCHLATFG